MKPPFFLSLVFVALVAFTLGAATEEGVDHSDKDLIVRLLDNSTRELYDVLHQPEISACIDQAFLHQGAQR